MKKILAALLYVCTALSVTGCGSQKTSYQFEAMDTFMTIDVCWSPRGNFLPLDEMIREIDDQLSTTNADGSDNYVFQINQKGEAVTFGELTRFVNETLALCEDTGGALDVTVYPVVEEWGFISGDHKIPSEERLAQLLPLVDHSKVKTSEFSVWTENKGMKLDFGAVAKGYAADKVIKSLKDEQANCEYALLNLGGTVAAYGKKPEGGEWKIGITDPDNTDTYMGTVSCTDKIIATSGSYERYFEGDDGKIYSHIIDPKTGCPVDNGIKSVTVISDSGLLSDGLSTALFVMGLDKAKEYYQSRKDFDFIILTDDKKAFVTAGAAESFTQAAGYEYETVII